MVKTDRAMHLMGNGAAFFPRFRTADFLPPAASRNNSSLKEVALAKASAAEVCRPPAPPPTRRPAAPDCAATAWNFDISSRRLCARWNKRTEISSIDSSAPAICRDARRRPSASVASGRNLAVRA